MSDGRTSHSSRTSPVVVFRCDATAETGLGHTSRSLALAEALIELGCTCSFVGHFDSAARQLLASAEMDSEALEVSSWGEEDASAMARLVSRRGACGIVVDSYAVGAAYVDLVDNGAAPVLLIDDFAALPHYGCSAILNFTSRADEYAYPQDRVQCFIGPRWFLGRRSLRQLRAEGPRPVNDVSRVLVSSGASDPHDIVLPVAEALLACDAELSIHVVVSARRANLDRLHSLLEAFRGETRVLTQLPGLSAEFAWSDLCISTAGLTKYEAAYVGVPSGSLSQNEGQARDTVRFASAGMTFDMGLAAHIDQDSLRANVDRLVWDGELRESLQRSSLAVFPVDPTRELALALLSGVFAAS